MEKKRKWDLKLFLEKKQDKSYRKAMIDEVFPLSENGTCISLFIFFFLPYQKNGTSLSLSPSFILNLIFHVLVWQVDLANKIFDPYYLKQISSK